MCVISQTHCLNLNSSFLSAGTDVTYRIQSDETLLSGSSVARGNVPQNITVTPEMVKQLGPGCHRLTLHASNMVTFPEVSADLQVNQHGLSVFPS